MKNAAAYGALYLDTDEDYSMVDKQIETFRAANPKYIFFDVVYKKGQTKVALAHRAQVIADLQDSFTDIPFGTIYVALAPGENNRPARDFMMAFIEEQKQ